LGYISFDKEGSELLFTHLSLRAGRKSTIITTNFSFERWEEIFKDPVMTAAMIDRLTHKSLYCEYERELLLFERNQNVVGRTGMNVYF